MAPIIPTITNNKSPIPKLIKNVHIRHMNIVVNVNDAIAAFGWYKLQRAKNIKTPIKPNPAKYVLLSSDIFE